jgi:uncharacterized damage-inducible protein DinB
MFKRTNGYILLILLVLTGFAGRVTGDTLNSKERRYLISHLKDTRTDLLQSVNGLSDAQLDYKPAKDGWSVRECLMHIVIVEKSFTTLAAETLKQPADKNKTSKIKDEELVAAMTNRTKKFTAPEQFNPATTPWKTEEEAIAFFKQNRAEAIKFVRTTTDNVRGYVAQAPFGEADLYQVYLGMSAHTARHTEQIREIKSSPGFPKK